MKDGIVTPVNSISAIDIRADEVARTSVSTEGVCLMGTRVGTQDCVSVDVIGIGTTSARVIGWESQGVKVLSDRDNRRQVVVVSILGTWEVRLDDLSSQGNRMTRLKMKPAGKS